MTNKGTFTTGDLVIKADHNDDHATAKLVMGAGSTNAIKGNITVDGSDLYGSAVVEIDVHFTLAGITTKMLTLQDEGIVQDLLAPINVSLRQGDGNIDVVEAGTTLQVDGEGNLVKEGAVKLVLTHNNTYTGETRIRAGELEIQGSLGYQDNGPYRDTAVYARQIVNNSVLTFDNTINDDIDVQVLAGNMTGSGKLNQFSDNLLVLTGSNKLTSATSDVVVGKVGANQKFSALRVAATGSLHASGNLTVNSAGYNNGAALTREHDYNLSTAILGSNSADGSVWNVDTSQIASGDDVNVTVAKGGFANATSVINAGNTMYFYSLAAQNNTGVGGLSTTWNNTARVSDIFINSLMLHNGAAIQMATTD